MGLVGFSEVVEGTGEEVGGSCEGVVGSFERVVGTGEGIVGSGERFVGSGEGFGGTGESVSAPEGAVGICAVGGVWNCLGRGKGIANMGGGNRKGGRECTVVEGRCKDTGCIFLFIRPSTLLLLVFVCFFFFCLDSKEAE